MECAFEFLLTTAGRSMMILGPGDDLRRHGTAYQPRITANQEIGVPTCGMRSQTVIRRRYQDRETVSDSLPK